MRKSCESVREGILLKQTVSVLRRQKVVYINKMETLFEKKGGRKSVLWLMM